MQMDPLFYDIGLHGTPSQVRQAIDVAVGSAELKQSLPPDSMDKLQSLVLGAIANPSRGDLRGLNFILSLTSRFGRERFSDKTEFLAQAITGAFALLVEESEDPVSAVRRALRGLEPDDRKEAYDTLLSIAILMDAHPEERRIKNEALVRTLLEGGAVISPYIYERAILHSSPTVVAILYAGGGDFKEAQRGFKAAGHGTEKQQARFRAYASILTIPRLTESQTAERLEMALQLHQQRREITERPAPKSPPPRLASPPLGPEQGIQPRSF